VLSRIYVRVVLSLGYVTVHIVSDIFNYVGTFGSIMVSQIDGWKDKSLACSPWPTVAVFLFSEINTKPNY